MSHWWRVQALHSPENAVAQVGTNFNYSHLTMPGRGRAGYIGHPYDDVECKLSDEGEILIKSPGNMLGYYNKPEETARVLREDGWFRTGDTGWLDETGRLTYTGRLGDAYKSRGFNVAPQEIEHVIARIEGVRQCAVVGIPAGNDDNVGVAYIVPEEGARLEAADILQVLKPKLASYKMPGEAFIVDDLPMTSGTGKVQKFKLREDAMARMKLTAG